MIIPAKLVHKNIWRSIKIEQLINFIKQLERKVNHEKGNFMITYYFLIKIKIVKDIKISLIKNSKICY